MPKNFAQLTPEWRAAIAKAHVEHGHYRGGRKSPTYQSWSNMLYRCKKDTDYTSRGIAVCDRWRNFGSFLADMGERPAGTTLDRIDNNGNYEPDNCRWATPAEQRNNRRDRVELSAEDISWIREGAGLIPQSLLAEAVGVSRWQISKVVRGVVR